MAAGRLGSIVRLHGALGARGFNGADMDIQAATEHPRAKVGDARKLNATLRGDCGAHGAATKMQRGV